jgi:hypothetical protein
VKYKLLRITVRWGVSQDTADSARVYLVVDGTRIVKHYRILGPLVWLFSRRLQRYKFDLGEGFERAGFLSAAINDGRIPEQWLLLAKSA